MDLLGTDFRLAAKGVERPRVRRSASLSLVNLASQHFLEWRIGQRGQT